MNKFVYLYSFRHPTFVKQFPKNFDAPIADELLVDFRRLFPSRPITFRRHKLTLSPKRLSQSGPLIKLCVQKYETEHQGFNRFTHVRGSFKRVPKTYAVRHHIRQYANWRNELQGEAKPQYSPGTSREMESAIEQFPIDPELTLLNFNDERVFVAKSFTLWGSVIFQHDVLILEINDSWPTLALINYVIAGQEEAVFACVLLVFVEYYHSRSYLIKYPSHICHRVLKNHSDLHDYHQLSFHHCFDASCSWFLVILRQKLGYNDFACLFRTSGLGFFEK